MPAMRLVCLIRFFAFMFSGAERVTDISQITAVMAGSHPSGAVTTKSSTSDPGFHSIHGGFLSTCLD